jgi:hypothetical protein
MRASSLAAVDQLHKAACDLSAACRVHLGIAENVMPLVAIYDKYLGEPLPAGMAALLQQLGEIE